MVSHSSQPLAMFRDTSSPFENIWITGGLNELKVDFFLAVNLIYFHPTQPPPELRPPNAHSGTYSYKSILIQILSLSLKVLDKTDNR